MEVKAEPAADEPVKEEGLILFNFLGCDLTPVLAVEVKPSRKRKREYNSDSGSESENDDVSSVQCKNLSINIVFNYLTSII